jgi:hypothetical protein
MSYIHRGMIVNGPPPPPLYVRRPLLCGSLGIAVAVFLSYALNAVQATRLSFPTSAHSFAVTSATDSFIARNQGFVAAYTISLPELVEPTVAGYFHLWRARLGAQMAGGARSLEPPLHAGVLATAAAEWANYGAYMGEHFDSTGPFQPTRAATSSYATQVFFCGALAANALLVDAASSTGGLHLPGVAALADTVGQAVQRGASAIIDVRLRDASDPATSNFFTLRTAPGEGVKLYMSCTKGYTLGAYLKRNPLPLTAAQWRISLLQLFSLEAARGPWPGSFAADAYNVLFDGCAAAGGRGGAKWEAGSIVIHHAAVCIVPPFNGTAADATAPQHAQDVAALLAPGMQIFSMYAAGN